MGITLNRIIENFDGKHMTIVDKDFGIEFFLKKIKQKRLKYPIISLWSLVELVYLENLTLLGIVPHDRMPLNLTLRYNKYENY